MSRNDQTYFETLKKRIVVTMQQSYPGINPSIAEWKGQEITDFQEELLKKVNANISEKWFYTHMKSTHPSLPRIDMLNFLSRYAGYSNWDDFVFKHRDLLPAVPVQKSADRYFWIIPLLVLAIICVFYGLFKLFDTQEYRFCFFDADTREPVINSKIEIRLLLENESPVTGYSTPDGCFLLKTDKSRVRLVVSCPYYKTDTIVRILAKLNHHEVVSLHANDYALMIHFFSNMKVVDWEKRRSRLEKMIGDDAMICQVFGDKAATGMELLNKEEFIDKMTVPSGSLKNIEILGTKFRDEKISVLKFRVKTERR
ncbi:MAG: hypothetical protein WCK34_02380 [Bacteroidota bacterium]